MRFRCGCFILVVMLDARNALVMAQSNTAIYAVAPPSYEEARRASWSLTTILVESLEADANEWPGTHAWLKDLREQTKGMTKDTPLAKWRKVDIGALVDHNPNFWRMYFETAPGDPTFTVIHAGLLLSQGEAMRAGYMLELGQHRPGIPKVTLEAIGALQNSAIAALRASNDVTQQGTKLFDQGDYDGAIKKYREAHKLCPTNGWTYYEMAYTVRTKAEVARGEPAVKPGTHTITVNVEPKNPPGVVEAFTEARRHDPLQYMAYQGSDPEVIKGMEALVKKAMPAWQSLRQPRISKAAEYHALQDVSEGFLDAGIYDLAIFARQLMVARRNSYDPSDFPILAASLRKLAPGPAIEEVLDRLAGKNGSALKLRPITKLEQEEGQPALGSGERLYIPDAPLPNEGADNRVRVDFTRLLTPEEEIAKRTTVEDLTKFMQDFRGIAEKVLGKYETPCKVVVRFACATSGHSVDIKHEPKDIDEKPLKELHEAITKLKRLPVKEKTVEFEIQLTVTPAKKVPAQKK
jgi:hypothetical protein